LPETNAPPRRASKSEGNDELFLRVYDDLRRIARKLNGAAHRTLTPTGLVNEVWLRIAGSASFQAKDEEHMRHSGVLAMRQILLDRNRRRNAEKRGGEANKFVTFNEELGVSISEPVIQIAFDQAMEELKRQCPRQAAVAMLRLFEQREDAEIAARLGVSQRTVARDWAFIKCWLSARLLPRGSGNGG